MIALSCSIPALPSFCHSPKFNFLPFYSRSFFFFSCKIHPGIRHPLASLLLFAGLLLPNVGRQAERKAQSTTLRLVSFSGKNPVKVNFTVGSDGRVFKAKRRAAVAIQRSVLQHIRISHPAERSFLFAELLSFLPPTSASISFSTSHHTASHHPIFHPSYTSFLPLLVSIPHRCWYAHSVHCKDHIVRRCIQIGNLGALSRVNPLKSTIHLLSGFVHRHRSHDYNLRRHLQQAYIAI